MATAASARHDITLIIAFTTRSSLVEEQEKRARDQAG
jgi:hypothetical protein